MIEATARPIGIMHRRYWSQRGPRARPMSMNIVVRSLVASIPLLAPGVASATYTPPLNEVRVDEDETFHTASLVHANEARTSDLTDLAISGTGLQYMGQFQWSFGFGVQVGLGVGQADVGGDLGAVFASIDPHNPHGAPVLQTIDYHIDTSGFWAGGQLRIYQMLWKSDVDITESRPSALTAFVNMRGLYYNTSGQGSGAQIGLEYLTVTGGAGAMAELSISDYFSICPYAWLTPGVISQLDYEIDGQAFRRSNGPSLRNPFLVGIDFWLYLSPPDWTDRISLSFLGSFVDTEGDDATFAAVVGYTF